MCSSLSYIFIVLFAKHFPSSKQRQFGLLYVIQDGRQVFAFESLRQLIENQAMTWTSFDI